jgi:hypothetical protein
METGRQDAGGEILDETVEEANELAEQDEKGIPSEPLFGRLPLARAIPQDVHSVLDYAGAATLFFAGLSARSPAARATGITLGLADAATSFMTDYRLSGPKLIPIEVHETLDYVVGISALLAPLWLGKRRGDRTARLLHVLVGASVILVSMVTDYRARRGRAWPRLQRLLRAGPT